MLVWKTALEVGSRIWRGRPPLMLCGTLQPFEAAPEVLSANPVGRKSPILGTIEVIPISGRRWRCGLCISFQCGILFLTPLNKWPETWKSLGDVGIFFFFLLRNAIWNQELFPKAKNDCLVQYTALSNETIIKFILFFVHCIYFSQNSLDIKSLYEPSRDVFPKMIGRQWLHIMSGRIRALHSPCLKEWTISDENACRELS